DDGRVVPIVGLKLLSVRQGERDVALQRLLAERMAERLRLPVAELPTDFTLGDVVSNYVQDRRRRKEDLYPRVSQAMKDLAPAPPQPLLDLAAIRPFNLFISVTFDSLLADAINAVRHGGNARTDTVTFAPNAPGDLAVPRKQLVRPVVFHLLGKLSASPEYVICDEDLLEYLHALQDDSRRPKLLFDELRESHLLILGCGLTNWLARFFLRTAKSQPLSLNRAETETVVDPGVAGDRDLVMFLENFSYNTRLVASDPAAFAAELRQRWEARHPPGTETQPAPAAPGVSQAATGAVFLSYASEDADAVRRLAQALEGAGIDVWFDKGELQAGDDWDRKIRKGIENCALFIPVLSRITQERRRAYFWQEWNMADECAGRMAPGEAFLVPVVIDDTPPYQADVPDRFRKAQWTPLPEGQTTPAFVEQVTKLYRQYHARQRMV
ncbi:MAG TPA: toll/interleukin-1 receptor domain-containing protein, partial [Burkholderiales bacterium]|nr:toll/interleukin-1 receptor domain-containing protein [Burkholderiales bacterium]